MTKPRGAAQADKVSAEFADAAANVFQHLGEASRRLMELQAQAAAIVLMDSTARCAEVLVGTLRSAGWRRWTRLHVRSAMEPLAAWIEAAAGLQAVTAAAVMQAAALMVFPQPPAPRGARRSERRLDSIVIPFPERRRGGRG